MAYDSGPSTPSTIPDPKAFEVDDRDDLSTFSEYEAENRLLRDEDLPLPPKKDFAFVVPQSSPPTTHDLSWTNIPEKSQLAILALSRLADFFQMSALQATMFHQLLSFDPAASDATISYQAGVLQGIFPCAQIFTALMWGRLADSAFVGRKRVLLISLVGQSISCLGVGFSNSFASAVCWRFLGGVVNGSVGSARTLLAETVGKQWHSRAFLLYPLAFNVANVLGPVLGSWTVEPVTRFPGLFGAGGVFGGEHGVDWMKRHPYAGPMLLSALVLLAESALVWLGIRESLRSRRFARDRGLEAADAIKRFLRRRACGRRAMGYTQLDQQVGEQLEVELGEATPGIREDLVVKKQKLPFRQIWTRNVCLTLLACALYDFHNGAFPSLWLVYLCTSRADTADLAKFQYPFSFTGGLAFSPQTVGFALAIIGFIGVATQLLLYPRACARWGAILSFRWAIMLFPVAYALTPYLSLLPSNSTSPAQATGPVVWFGISSVLLLRGIAMTFAVPGILILLNNCTPHPSVLATIHGLGQSVACLFRTVGPMVAGKVYADGLERGVIGYAWWVMAFISIGAWIQSWWVRNGNGHEVLLDGEKEEGTQK